MLLQAYPTNSVGSYSELFTISRHGAPPILWVLFSLVVMAGLGYVLIQTGVAVKFPALSVTLEAMFAYIGIYGLSPPLAAWIMFGLSMIIFVLFTGYVLLIVLTRFR